MRPDTPQKYEYITIDNVKGNSKNILLIKPWTQFFDLKGFDTIPLSYADNITFKNIDMLCNTYFNVTKSNQYILSNFIFDNINVIADTFGYSYDVIDNARINSVNVEEK